MNFCLKDVWRIQNPDKRQYSWLKGNNRNIASRIDFALVSAGLDQKVEAIMYISAVKTDHRAIYMVIETSQNSRGRGYWKLNTLLLQDKEYLQMMNSELDSILTSTEMKPPKDRWSIIKMRIKKSTVNFSRNKNRQEQYVIAELTEKVNEYEDNMPLEQNDYLLYSKTKQDLEEKMEEKVKGMIFRSKVKWYELGEKGSKYFFSLEKARYNAKTCYKLINEEGHEMLLTQDILNEQRKFYSTLYEQDQDVQFDLQNTHGIYVPDEIRKQQEKQINVKDLEGAIIRMNNNKTPGSDGIPVDFYKVFWKRLKEPFVDMMMESYEQDELEASLRTGILNLIPKAGKDTRYIKNLRPITLLNTDYKIIEKAIADKMMPALERIIHQDQRGFMKDRRISVNIRKMLDIMHQAERQDLEAIVLSLDFVKCFDKCSFSILHGSLEYFKFGDIIKHWTKILYNNFEVKIQNNGHFSENVKIRKGVHQGGCCSSVYFLVIAEILAISLRANQEIDGITFQQIRNLLNQFADDMDIYILHMQPEIN